MTDAELLIEPIGIEIWQKPIFGYLFKSSFN